MIVSCNYVRLIEITGDWLDSYVSYFTRSLLPLCFIIIDHSRRPERDRCRGNPFASPSPLCLLLSHIEVIAHLNSIYLCSSSTSSNF